MSDITEVKRFGGHKNAFGVLRLLFASLVIVSHTPEIVDGDRNREILTRIFGSVSFGELSVDSFFILSGILIPSSFYASRSIRSFLVKRIARIYPAFIVCCLICLTVVVPVSGGSMRGHWPDAIKNILLLITPSSYGAFSGSHDPYLNGSLWTIQIEFKCYLLVLALGLIKLLDKPVFLVFASAAMLLLYQNLPSSTEHHVLTFRHHPEIWGRDIVDSCRLAGMFLAGSAFRLIEPRVRLKPSYVVAAAVALAVCLGIPPLAQFGLATAGVYLIYCVAAGAAGTPIARINDRTDVSYGVYLYAWPIEKLLIAAGMGALNRAGSAGGIGL